MEAVTLDTTLGAILDDPQAKAVLDQYLPGVSDNPLAQMAKGMSLRMILSMPQAAQLGLTEIEFMQQAFERFGFGPIAAPANNVQVGQQFLLRQNVAHFVSHVVHVGHHMFRFAQGNGPEQSA